MSNAKQNIGNKYVVTREFNGSFLKNQLLSYNPYIIVKYSQGEQNRTEVHLPKHKATAYANQSLIGSNDDAYYIDRKGSISICYRYTDARVYPGNRKEQN